MQRFLQHCRIEKSTRKPVPKGHVFCHMRPPAIYNYLSLNNASIRPPTNLEVHFGLVCRPEIRLIEPSHLRMPKWYAKESVFGRKNSSLFDPGRNFIVQIVSRTFPFRWPFRWSSGNQAKFWTQRRVSGNRPRLRGAPWPPC